MTPRLDIRAPLTDCDWEEYFHLRWRVLRQPWGQPIGSERDEFERVATHRYALLNDTMIGVGRIHGIDKDSAQIRYMAVLPAYRRRGVGMAILTSLEQYAKDSGVSDICLNARTGFLDFYLRMGYTVVGEGPTLYSSIKHKRLKKTLIGPMQA